MCPLPLKLTPFHCPPPPLRIPSHPLRANPTSTSSTTKPSRLLEWSDNFGDRYSLGETVGQGSFGSILLARGLHQGEQVAVKKMAKQRGRLTVERTRQKTELEVSILAELQSCQGVVGLMGQFLHEDYYHVVMEYCTGGDLKRNVKVHGPVEEVVAAAVAHEVLSVLRACKDAQIVHGDVKCANFIVQSADCNPFRNRNSCALQKGWLKAIDFGCSRYLRGSGPGYIRGRNGTPVYMAPEVFSRRYAYEADLWSLGMLVFYLVTGRFPFWGNEEEALMISLTEVKNCVSRIPVSFASCIEAGLSNNCVDFLERLLVRDSSKRMTVKEAQSHPFLVENLIIENDVVLLQRSGIATIS